jgi:hypothetical protein
MNQQLQQKQEEQQGAVRDLPLDPGHVMTRQHYERLAREAEAARQK